MTKYFLLLLFGFFSLTLAAQQIPYFQQEVNFRIVATLDDRAHTLTGTVDMEYINHSPDTLREIWMHLWANAFKNRKTAFANQKLRDANAKFYFADDEDLGYYKNLNFTTEGQKITLKYDPENPDIARLILTTPLLPGATMRISTPFLLKIPASFSRLGRVETSYQMTQWYPKPAVYDRKGWHAMPYLDQGEFYSEFGAFDVTLTLPDNYVVGATGTLQTPSEINFLAQKEIASRAILAKGVDAKKDTFPRSSSTLKTLRYTAEKVHDFAWFADKRFFVLKDTAHLANGKTVDCWAMFTNSEAEIWKKGASYVRRSIEFYSEHVGEYPWPQATAVHSALSAGGGMEYPMITVIADSGTSSALDEVITHEIGHNWFYGILASNERDHPFLDEGFNTAYENRYMKQYYGGSTYDHFLPKWLYNPDRNGPLIETAILLLAREHKDTPPDSPSDHFTNLGYGIQAYAKTGWNMRWLEQSVGTAQFDKAMKAYYEKWQFRHPYPEDVYAVWQSAGMDVPWFFESMKRPNNVDFRIKSVKKPDTSSNKWMLTIENRGWLNAPFSVTALRDGQPLKTEWLAPQAGPRRLYMEAPAETDAFEIDHAHEIIDLNRKNNTRRTSGLFPGIAPPDIRMLAPVQNGRRNTIGILPWIGWNKYDQLMPGILLYNPPLPTPRFQYYLAPAFGLGSKNLTGVADVRWNIFRHGLFSKVTPGVSAKTFSADYNKKYDYHARYYRIVPQIRAELRENSPTFNHALNFRTLFIGQEGAVFSDTVFTGTAYNKRKIHEISYDGQQKRMVNPFRYKIALEWQKYKDPFDVPASYLRGTAEWKQDFYFKPGRAVSARVFGGYFLKNTQRNRGAVSNDLARASFALNPQGFNDYRFDQVFFGRNSNEGILSRQVSLTEGGFKGAFGPPFAGVIGNSNNFILALNLRADLPRRLPLGLPLKPWFDVGYYDDASPLGADRPRSEQLLWSGGVLLEFGKGIFEVYFPLANSPFLKNQYLTRSGGTNTSGLFGGGNYWKWISWSLNVPLRGPSGVMDGLLR